MSGIDQNQILLYTLQFILMLFKFIMAHNTAVCNLHMPTCI